MDLSPTWAGLKAALYRTASVYQTRLQHVPLYMKRFRYSPQFGAEIWSWFSKWGSHLQGVASITTSNFGTTLAPLDVEMAAGGWLVPTSSPLPGSLAALALAQARDLWFAEEEAASRWAWGKHCVVKTPLTTERGNLGLIPTANSADGCSEGQILRLQARLQITRLWESGTCPPPPGCVLCTFQTIRCTLLE